MSKVKPITLTVGNETYTLEFSRESVRFAESKGFVIEEVETYPLTRTNELFYYAFRMHHRNLSREKTDGILEKMGGLRAEELVRLGELYLVPIETVINVNDDNDEERKNSKVSVEL